MSAEIREVSAAFSGVLAAIHAGAFVKPWPEASLHRLLIQPSVLALMASEGDVPCGFLLCQTAGSEGEILTLAVSPAFRRCRIALSLIEALKARARTWPAERLLLEVAEDNAAARSLYNRCGFSILARRRGYYRRDDGGRADAIVMSCDL